MSAGKNRQAQKPKRNITRKDKTDMAAKAKVEPLQPLNDKQKQYINAIRHGSSVIICTGVLGSSKTFIPSCIAAEWLESKKIDKVIIARPTEGKGKSLGYFKGDKDEKLAGWCAPITDTLKVRLGEGVFDAYLENGKIELLALEQVKGRSWDDTMILVDEAEDLEPAVAKSLVTRQGYRSKTIITGDLAQQDLKNESGLQVLLKVAKMCDLDLTHIDFDSWDYCVRSEEAKQWGMGFEEYEKENGTLK